MNPRILICFLGVAFLACATTTPGARPHEMSTEQHEAAAKQEEQAAADHSAQYDPAADVTRNRCGPRGGYALRAGVDTDICWTSITNPTDAHRRQADEHRRHAADHRAGSASLREAEARACVGVSSEDRDLSPFEHVEDIASVLPLKTPDANARGKLPNEQMVGAVVTFRAVPGMTVEWLHRVVDCHLARSASLGHVVPEMPNCPLVPGGAAATVSSTGNGFAVSIQSNNPAAAREILARAQRLVPAAGTSGSSQQ